ncbi:phenylphosphate carboxylase subunit delta [Pseudoxanthomonas yeongjuensis]|uniref:KdsC family phosphatase n=1 Tax=Pseudoxanthomonas yeongjuensis TaxID=377616 RepID=UPI0013910FC7|nr:HAD hydrolase family protein [Pseudoxanthomonas yeongjuensis]KAF1718512.1 phenylphosphate carboxylase subunit delta [Pseudoxanthomonas yeongjuensis]
MPNPRPQAITADIRERAAKIRLACFDVDGTLTDGRLHYDSEGRESKDFHVLDGQGMVLLKRFGIQVAFITARNSQSAAHRARDLGVQGFIGTKDKLAQVRALCEEQGIDLGQVAFMGDDLPDLEAMLAVGLSVAPANAHRWIADRARWITNASGGQGAARELCDLLLDAQGHTHVLLAGSAP